MGLRRLSRALNDFRNNSRYDETYYYINVPNTYDGPKKIVVLADVHDKITPYLKQFVRKVEADAIFIPGDLCNEHIVDGSHVEKGKKKYGVSEQGLEFLKLCARKCPVYYSKGNHEWMFDDRDISAIKMTGTNYIDNSYLSFSDNVFIGALSSPLEYIRNGIFPECPKPNIDWLEEFQRLNGYKILLCHHPEYYPLYLKNKSLNLIVSGHAHGGQIRIGNQGLWAPGQGPFPQYTSGFIDVRLVVSRGLANNIRLIPRINNREEIVVLCLGQYT